MAPNSGRRPADCDSQVFKGAAEQANNKDSRASATWNSPVTAAGPEASIVSGAHMLTAPHPLFRRYGADDRNSGSPPTVPYNLHHQHQYHYAVQQLAENPTALEESSVLGVHHDESMSVALGLLSHPSGKKRRLRNDQVKSLEESFGNESKLEPERKNQLAQELGLQPRQVAVWFQNRRARCKAKQLERDYGILKARYDAVTSEKETLEAEVAKLRSLLDNQREESFRRNTQKQLELQADQDDKVMAVTQSLNQPLPVLKIVPAPHSSSNGEKRITMPTNEQSYGDAETLSMSDSSDQTDVADASPTEAGSSSLRLVGASGLCYPGIHHQIPHSRYEEQKQRRLNDQLLQPYHHDFRHAPGTDPHQFAFVGAAKLPLIESAVPDVPFPQQQNMAMPQYVKLENELLAQPAAAEQNTRSIRNIEYVDYTFHPNTPYMYRAHGADDDISVSMLYFNSLPHGDP